MSQSLAIIFVSIFVYSAIALQCVNEAGSPVDWVFAYKLPPSQESKNELIKRGVAYVTMSSSEPNWTLSKVGIHNGASVLARHMKFYLNGKDKLSFLAYIPDGKMKKSAPNTKGLILADSDGGFWVTGTELGFPGQEKKFTYPAKGTTHAELFSCISMDLNMLDNVGTSLIYSQAQIYGAHIIPDMRKSLPTLISVMSGKKSPSAPWYHSQFMFSKNLMSIISYSKSRKYNGDLYNFIASDSNGDFMVRSSTWKKDGLTSNCTSPKVENIKELYIEAAATKITNPQDNAKWAISPKGNMICIGDTDRIEIDKLRGGGVTCISNDNVIKNFQEIIKTVEKCP